jgi:hypothetical protein
VECQKALQVPRLLCERREATAGARRNDERNAPRKGNERIEQESVAKSDDGTSFPGAARAEPRKLLCRRQKSDASSADTPQSRGGALNQRQFEGMAEVKPGE